MVDYVSYQLVVFHHNFRSNAIVFELCGVNLGWGDGKKENRLIWSVYMESLTQVKVDLGQRAGRI